jgi:hypothetical protein
VNSENDLTDVLKPGSVVESFKDDILAQLKAANVDAPVNECDD